MIVLDTNVISELMRSSGSPRVFDWAARQIPAELFTTVITEAEVFYGVELVAKGKRRDKLLAGAESMFGEDLQGRILVFDSQGLELTRAWWHTGARLAGPLAAPTRKSRQSRKHMVRRSPPGM